MTTVKVDMFKIGGVAALEAFRDQIVEDRGLIENETEPVFDVIVDLLNKVIQVMIDEHHHSG